MLLKNICRFKTKAVSLQRKRNMVVVAQLVRASDCGSEGRGFEPHLPPNYELRMVGLPVIRNL